MGKSSKSTKRAREEDESAAPVETPAAVAMDVDTTSTTAPKSKKSKKDKSAGDEDSKEIPKEALAVIASPLAQKKTAKHVLKLVKKGMFNIEQAPPLGLSLSCNAVPAWSDRVLAILSAIDCSASKSRHLKRGVKEVVKSIRKGEKGCVRCLRHGAILVELITSVGCSIVVLAADISPIDILTHIPLLSEEANCPYIVCRGANEVVDAGRR